jgi:opacity protein-like surface antigen
MKRSVTRAVLVPVALIVVSMAGALSSSPLFAQDTTTTTTTTTPQYQPASNAAGIRWDGWGPRVGVSFDPDQVWGGVHFNLGYFARDVRFRPTISMGFGDDITLIQAMAEAHYIFSKVQVWKPYVGGGIGIDWIDSDDDDDDWDSDTEIAFAAVGGVETKLRSGILMGFEGRIGFGDADPDVMLGVTWSFR